jgi:FixJ family two-component response regulator
LANVLPIIAIIDDDEIAREATLNLVQSLGYQTSTFASAEEFFQSERIHDVACIISDLHMPGLSGIDLQDRLIAHDYRIPIIFITGHPDDGARARAMKAGAVGFMSKPYNVELLVGCLREASKAF